MYCKNCGNKLNDKDVFCANCKTKIDINVEIDKTSNNINNDINEKVINNNVGNTKKNKIINTIFKILLIFNLIQFIIWLEGVSEDEFNIILSFTMMATATIGILKTQQKKSNIFLILGIIAIVLPIFMYLLITFIQILFLPFANLFHNSETTIDIIDIVQENIHHIIYKPFLLILPITIGIIFIIIHKCQKFKNNC